MRVSGEQVIAAPRDVVWEALMDPDVIAATLPGCERLEEIGEREYRGTMNVRVGPVQGQFDAQFALTHVEVLEGYRLKVSGRGQVGFLDGEGEVALRDEGGSTRLVYDFDARIGGRVASIGQRLLDSSARVVSRQALQQLERKIQERCQTSEPDLAPGEKAPLPVSAPSQGRMAAGIAWGVLRDLVPVRMRIPLIVFLVVALVALVFILAGARTEIR